MKGCWITPLAVTLLAGIVVSAQAALVLRAEDAAVRTEGGPNPGGGWNLWSNGRVGQPLRIATAGTYHAVVRAWGSPAGGVWPEMALLVDGRAVKTITVGGAQRANYGFDVELAEGIHEIAAAFLNDAVIGKEDRNLYLDHFTISPPPGMPDPVLASMKEVSAAAEKREREIVAATQSAVEKYRKADATVRVVDAGGRAMPGVQVSIEQTAHEFLFGCNIYGFDRLPDEEQNAAYKRRFAELFNYATVGFYWRWYEPQRGTPNYQYTDKVVAWCHEHGIRMKGHPLLWGDEAGVPPWSHGQPSPEIQRQRVRDIIGRYQGKIEFWEVVNEPSHLAEPKIDQPYRWARQSDPHACLIVNDYYVLADGGPGFFKLLTTAKRNGVPFDGIGIQAHEPRTMRFPLDRVQEILDQYAALGKGLNITEFTPTSAGQRITGSHREGVWDEAAQADFAVKFYRVCFAHPAMRAITWWDLSDQGSWLPGGGMLRADMSPKPVYEQLKRLIHQEWKTALHATTDNDGRFSFRGFCGKYRLVFDVQGRKMEHQLQVTNGVPKEVVVKLAMSATPTPAFILGADISWVQQQEDEGTHFSDQGVQKDIFAILKDRKFNWIRLRIFNNPQAEKGYSRQGYCDLDHTLQMAKRIKAASMGFLLDFHYSDTWADPEHQVRPSAWKDLHGKELEKAVQKYTGDVVTALKRQGTPPDMVQIGNEISNGFLWPDGQMRKSGDWDTFCGLIKAGIRGARDADPSVKIMLHIACGGQNAQSRAFMDKVLARRVEFDILGQSYYPRWHGTPDDLKANLTDLAGRYKQDIIVVEYAAPHLKEINDIVHDIPKGKGLGTFFWEPTKGGPGGAGVFERNGNTKPEIDVYPEMARRYGR